MKTIHFNYLPNVTYSISQQSLFGLSIGFGNAKSKNYNDFQRQIEYFKSNSSAIGLFYRYHFLKFNNVSSYLQSTFQYSFINQTTEIHQDNGQSGTFITQGLNISSIDLEFRIEVSYTLLRRISILGFVSNDIVSKETTKVKVAFIEPTDKWLFFKNYLIYGIGLQFKF